MNPPSVEISKYKDMKDRQNMKLNYVNQNLVVESAIFVNIFPIGMVNCSE